MAYLIFALRLAIGGLLIAAGLFKAHDGPMVTASYVAGYRILPPALVAPIGIALPYVEIVLGGYFVLGLFTRFAAWFATAQFAVFGVAIASLVIRKISADCGCFGSGVRTPPSWGHVAADLALAGVTALIALRSPGAFAIDRALQMSDADDARSLSVP